LYHTDTELEEEYKKEEKEVETAVTPEITK